MQIHRVSTILIYSSAFISLLATIFLFVILFNQEKPPLPPYEMVDEIPEPPVVEKPPAVFIPPTTPPTSYSSSTQFVLLAFDGSRSLSMWRDTMQFAETLSASTPYPVRFTYFISGVYLISSANKEKYTSPPEKSGASLIGFGTTEKEVLTRMQLIHEAQQKGHEIASHANGHFNGAPWNYEEWKSEFEQFQTIVNDPVAYNSFSTSTPWIDVSRITGFRAPNLGVNKDMFDLLPTFGFTYDTSITSSRMDAQPKKNAQGLWQFYLPSISRGNGSRVLAMDYNFFVAHTGGQELLTRTDPRWQEYHDDMLGAYRNYFNHNYRGNRAPVYIGHHFSLWNSDLYYEVFKDFAREVCVQPDVACVTYEDLVEYLEMSE